MLCGRIGVLTFAVFVVTWSAYTAVAQPPLIAISVDISAGQGTQSGVYPSAVVDAVNSKLIAATLHTGNSGKPFAFVCELDGTSCVARDISTGRGPNAGITPSAVIDTINSKLLVVTTDLGVGNSLIQLLLLRCNLDGLGCAAIDISAGQGYGSGQQPSAVIDFVNAKLVVAALHYAGGGNKPYVYICNLDGTSCIARDVSAGQGTGSGLYNSVAIDTINSKVLVVTTNQADQSKPYLFYCDLITGVNCVARDISAGEGPSCGTFPSAVVDATNSKLLVVTQHGSAGNRPYLFRCNLDGTSCVATDISAGVSGADPSAVIDTVNSKLLVAAKGPSNLPYLFRCNLDGTNSTAVDISAGAGPNSGTNPSAVWDPIHSRLLTVATHAQQSDTLWLFTQDCADADMSTRAQCTRGCGDGTLSVDLNEKCDLPRLSSNNSGLAPWQLICLPRSCGISLNSYTAPATHSQNAIPFFDTHCVAAFEGLVIPQQTEIAARSGGSILSIASWYAEIRKTFVPYSPADKRHPTAPPPSPLLIYPDHRHHLSGNLSFPELAGFDPPIGFEMLSRYEIRAAANSTSLSNGAPMSHETNWVPFVTTCSCTRCASGAPNPFAVRQSGVHVYFAWTDDSVCEERFNVYRAAELSPGVFDPEPVFLASFAFRAKARCGTRYAPTSDPDLVRELVLGATYQYCMEAQTSVPFEYSTPRGCMELNVAFTAFVQFKVSTENGIAVRDTRLNVSFAGQHIIELTTDRNGDASVTVTLPGVRSDFIDLDVAIASPIYALQEHVYSCRGLSPCNLTTVPVSHLGSTLLTVFDLSVISVTGTIVVADTAPFTGFDEFSSGPACPLADRDVRVCAHTETTLEEIQCVGINGDALAGPLGTYILVVPLGLTARISVSWARGLTVHTFRPVGTLATLSATARVLASNGDVRNLDFEDTTMQMLRVRAVASRCELYFGPSVFTLRMSKTCPQFRRAIHAGGVASLVETSFIVPAAFYEVVFARLDDAPALASIRFPDSSISPVNLNEYFALVDENVVEQDLSDRPGFAYFVYRKAPALALTGKPTGSLFDTGACAAAPVRVVKQARAEPMAVTAVEDYGEAGVCANVTGLVRLFDEVSQPSLPCSSRGSPGYCETPLVVNSQTGESKAEFGMIPGEPNVVPPHVLVARFQMTLKPGMALSTLAVPFFVEGSRSRGQPFTLRLPKHTAQLVLHDPPGDGSFASWSKGTSTSFDMSLSSTTSETKTWDVGGYVGAAGETELCIIALVAGTCTQTVKAEGRVGFSGGGSSANAKSTDSSMSTTITAGETYTTSGDQGGSPPGKMSDMVVCPVLTIQFSQADVVKFNDATCAGEMTAELVWLPYEDKANAILFQSRDDITNQIIPEIARVLLIAPASDLVKIALLNSAMSGWNSLIASLEATYNGAGRSPLAVGVVNPDETGSTGAPNEFVFGGGGAVLTRTQTSSVSRSRTTSTTSVVSKSKVLSMSVDMQIFFIQFGMSASFAFNSDIETSASKTVTSGESTTTEYSLSDDDSGDFFEVAVYSDEAFGTPLFEIRAGASSCPFEGYIGTDPVELAKPGTIKRETFQTLLRSANLIENLPANGVPLWTIEVQNLSPYEETLQLVFGQIGASNPDSLAFRYAGGNLGPFGTTIEVPYGTPFLLNVEATRGPRAWTYDDVQLRVFSACEYSIDPLVGDRLLSAVTSVSARFLQPCPSVSWAGELNVVGAWTVNTNPSPTPGRLKGYIRNAEYAVSTWSAHRRVQSVALEYRFPGDLDWSAARDTAGEKLILASRVVSLATGEVSATSREDQFGYAVFEWDLNAFPDGKYDIRAIVECEPSPVGGDFDETVTPVLGGTLDRARPSLFGSPEPADGVWFPGDLVMFRFDEDILCATPHTFTISLQIDAVEYGRDVAVKCSGDTVELDLLNAGPRIAELGGATVSMTVSGARDLAGNFMSESGSHTFTVFEYSQEAATATVGPISLRLRFDDFIAARAAFVTSFIGELASLVAPAIADSSPSALTNRLAISSALRTSAGFLELKLFVSAGASPTAADIATAVTRSLGSAVSGARLRMLERALSASGHARDANEHVVDAHRVAAAVHSVTRHRSFTPAQFDTDSQFLLARSTRASERADTSMLALLDPDAVAPSASISPTAEDAASAALQSTLAAQKKANADLITADGAAVNSASVTAGQKSRAPTIDSISTNKLLVIVGTLIVLVLALLVVVLAAVLVATLRRGVQAQRHIETSDHEVALTSSRLSSLSSHCNGDVASSNAPATLTSSSASRANQSSRSGMSASPMLSSETESVAAHPDYDDLAIASASDVSSSNTTRSGEQSFA